MANLKLAADLAGLRLPFRSALAAVADLGLSAVEVDARGEIRPGISRTAVREIRKLLEDNRLQVASVAFRTRRGYADEDQLDRRVAGTKAAMDLAYALGATVVVNHIGRVPPAESASSRLLRDVLADLGSYGARAGARLAVETGQEGPDVLVGLLKTLPPGELGVDLNPGRLLLAGHSPQEAIAQLAGSIVHVHLTDAERGTSPGEGTPVRLGRGHVDIPALLGLLDETDFRGYYTVQPSPSADPLEEIRAAVAYLRRL